MNFTYILFVVEYFSIHNTFSAKLILLNKLRPISSNGNNNINGKANTNATKSNLLAYI